MAYTLGNKFVNGQFYFNLSWKMWSHVFLEHSVLGQGSGLVVKKTARKYSQLFPIVGYYVEEV